MPSTRTRTNKDDVTPSQRAFGNKLPASFVSISRNQVAPLLRQALSPYFTKLMYSLHFEVGVERGGHLRADVVCVKMDRSVTIVEVKSGWQDFAADHKWQRYLPFCNQFYFAVSDALWDTHADRLKEALAGSGAGIIVCRTGGPVRKVLPAAKRKMAPARRIWLFTKLAWISGLSRARRVN